MDATAKQARAEYQREYRAKNRERLNSYRRQWNKDNPDKVRKYQADYWNRKAEAKQKEKGDGG